MKISEKFKDFRHLCVECKDFNQLMMIRDLLVKENFKELPTDSQLAECKVIGVYLDDKEFRCCESCDVNRIKGTYNNYNHAIVSFNNLVDVKTKLEFYFSDDVLKCIDYVVCNDELDVVDVISRNRIKWRNIFNNEIHIEDFEEFFEHIAMLIEEEFYECMKNDYEDLNDIYELLKASRKVMRDL
jgi:hypothetical protein